VCASARTTTVCLAQPLLQVMDTVTRPHKPFLCRANLRHRWEHAHTSDGGQYIRCSRCLKERWTTPGANTVTGFSLGGGGG
jgi:hypothetical protein